MLHQLRDKVFAVCISQAGASPFSPASVATLRLYQTLPALAVMTYNTSPDRSTEL